MDDIELTQHSIEKTKERIGLSKKLAEKNARRALERGLTHADCKAGLRRYIDKRFFINHNTNNVRIYHRYVYIFCDKKLVTVFPLPNKFCDLADKLQRQKEELRDEEA